MNEFIRVSQKSERLIVGVMSGTSLDGVDMALVRLNGSDLDLEFELKRFSTYPMPLSWRKRIQDAFEADTAELCKINFDLGFFFGELVCRFCRESGLDLNELDAVGCHGQTLYHIDRHSTLQSGEADVIADLTKTLVVSDFRTADIAAGGSGAPLVPYMDRILFKKRNENIALQNLGGIGNVTFLPKGLDQDILAFDTGPANAILNELVEIITKGEHGFDQDAFLSQQGILQPKVLEDLLNHEYFRRPLPKSTGRELFGRDYVRQLLQRYSTMSPVDLLRTTVSLISHSIVEAYNAYLPKLDKVYISGGGAHHPIIFEELQGFFGEDGVEKMVSANGITVDSKEAVAFAVLAHERINDTPTNIPSVTGARRKTTLGKISIPYLNG
ncbi:MAG: anhydro-N-acetylmuramic acid kinase [Proteobacteria bacterium]|nr:anhydro-N-acetylmuramic acid kinase [Pseudomonadota bacterium]